MNLEKKGAAQAAFLSAMFGCLTLALVNVGTEMSEAFKDWVHWVGKLWIPGAQGIGPYSGKETFMLVGWFLSWLVLYRLLRNREWNNALVLAIFLVGIGVATTLIWPPVFIHLAGHH